MTTTKPKSHITSTTEYIYQINVTGMADMPLLSILQFQENDLPMPAEELVDLMLGQVYAANE